MPRLLAIVLLLCSAALTSTDSHADDKQQLTVLLEAFLAGASIGDIATHERFWGEELVYTSSAGTRTDRNSIITGMQESPAPDGPPSVIYSAEDIDIRVYDDMAVVAFMLVGTPADSAETTRYYLNTGTFVKRDDRWQAIAWQATHKAISE